MVAVRIEEGRLPVGDARADGVGEIRAGDLYRAICVERWLEAGQHLLRRDGLRGLKLRSLVELLGATTGSFYHYFSTFGVFQRALADHYAGPQIVKTLERVRRLEKDPIGRIRLLGSVVRQRNMGGLSIAMRAWAADDDYARHAVERNDAIVLRFLEDCLVQEGFSEADAGVRAYALLMLGQVKVHAPGVDCATVFNGLVDVMTAKNEAARRRRGNNEVELRRKS